MISFTIGPPGERCGGCDGRWRRLPGATAKLRAPQGVDSRVRSGRGARRPRCPEHGARASWRTRRSCERGAGERELAGAGDGARPSPPASVDHRLRRRGGPPPRRAPRPARTPTSGTPPSAISSESARPHHMTQRAIVVARSAWLGPEGAQPRVDHGARGQGVGGGDDHPRRRHPQELERRDLEAAAPPGAPPRHATVATLPRGRLGDPAHLARVAGAQHGPLAHHDHEAGADRARSASIGSSSHVTTGAPTCSSRSALVSAHEHGEVAIVLEADALQQRRITGGGAVEDQGDEGSGGRRARFDERTAGGIELVAADELVGVAVLVGAASHRLQDLAQRRACVAAAGRRAGCAAR